MNHRMPDKMTILNELWLCSRRTPLMRLTAILMRLFSWAASQAASMLSEAALSCRQQPTPGKPFRQSGVRRQADSHVSMWHCPDVASLPLVVYLGNLKAEAVWQQASRSIYTL